jgi:hypothetical protein
MLRLRGFGTRPLGHMSSEGGSFDTCNIGFHMLGGCTRAALIFRCRGDKAASGSVRGGCGVAAGQMATVRLVPGAYPGLHGLAGCRWPVGGPPGRAALCFPSQVLSGILASH